MVKPVSVCDTKETEEDLLQSRPHSGGSVWVCSCFPAEEIEDDIRKLNDTVAPAMELKAVFQDRRLKACSHMGLRNGRWRRYRSRDVQKWFKDGKAAVISITNPTEMLEQAHLKCFI